MTVKLVNNGNGEASVVVGWGLKILAAALSGILVLAAAGTLALHSRITALESNVHHISAQLAEHCKRNVEWQEWHERNYPPPWLLEQLKEIRQELKEHRADGH